MPPLDHDHCYSIVKSGDRRFDGWFVTAVRTTGIYCRPSCPAITPKQTNVEFHHTPAAAQQRGFRACKRCRPDASPGSPEWNLRQDVVGRAMRLIADGVIERDGVPGLARQLGYSERHLNRVMTDELGAGPLAIARAHRAHTARLLIETTTMTFTDIAFAAGFGSIRQFNDTVQQVFASSPTDLRARRSRGAEATAADTAGEVSLRLPTRGPFAGRELLGFLAGRVIPGIETFDGTTYRRSLALPNGPGTISVSAHDDHVEARVKLNEWADLATCVQRVRRLLDLDADPVAVDIALGSHPSMRPLVAATPGRRAPGSVDPYETAVRAVIGQQVSVSGAATVAGRIVEAVGEPLPVPLADDELTHVFPSPERLADATDEGFAMPTARRATVRGVARAVADGSLRLGVGADPDEARSQLLALKGVGPWTADYVVMRGLSHPDQFLGTDLGVVRALDSLGLDPDDSRQWAPWRSYAVHHLWAHLSAPRPVPNRTSTNPSNGAALATVTDAAPTQRIST